MAKRFRFFLSSAGRNWAGPTRHVVRGPTTAPTWKRQGNDKAATKTDNRRTPCQRSFRLEPLPLACVGPRRSGRLSAACGAGFQVAYGKGFPYATQLRDWQRNIDLGNHDCADMHAHCAETSRWALPCFFPSVSAPKAPQGNGQQATSVSHVHHHSVRARPPRVPQAQQI